MGKFYKKYECRAFLLMAMKKMLTRHTSFQLLRLSSTLEILHKYLFKENYTERKHKMFWYFPIKYVINFAAIKEFLIDSIKF